jgi:hypothetical protein
VNEKTAAIYIAAVREIVFVVVQFTYGGAVIPYDSSYLAG